MGIGKEKLKLLIGATKETMGNKGYWEKRNNKIDKLPLDELRRVTKVIDKNSQKFFSNWMKAERQIKELQIKLCFAKK